MPVMTPCIAVLVRDLQRSVLPLPVKRRQKRRGYRQVATLRGERTCIKIKVGEAEAIIPASGEWLGSMLLDAADLYRMVKGLPMAEAAMLRPFEGVLEITVGRYRAELPNQPDNARYRSMAAFDLLEALDVTTLPLFQERE